MTDTSTREVMLRTGLQVTDRCLTYGGMATLEVNINGESKDLETGTTIAQLLNLLELPPRYVAVERNLQLIPRADHGTCVLEPGDQLEIVTLVGGG